MKNYLFPRVFQIIGWVLFIPALIMGSIIILEMFDYSTGIDLPTGVMETVMNDAIIIGISLGAIFIVCSREKTEDEMTNSIRLSALMNALYVYVVLLVVATLFINGVNFFWVMTFNMVLLPIIYVIIFRSEMHKYYKMSEDEE